MKNNKIERKIKRLEAIKVIIEMLENEIIERESIIDNMKESIKNIKEEREINKWRILSYEKEIERITIEKEEIEKIIADLEKMS